MRNLSIEEIEALSRGNGVRKFAVKNFLLTMGTNENVARQNMKLDSRLYQWNSATENAIISGINLACENKK